MTLGFRSAFYSNMFSFSITFDILYKHFFRTTHAPSCNNNQPNVPPRTITVQHDAQLDYFGKTLATCSSDRTIKIFKVTADTEQHTLVKELRGHDGPVWKVAWAHPMFGQMLASCSHDAKVMVWKDGT